MLFFAGWILSPLTFWNDSFVNIPIAYLCANIFIRFLPVKFLLLVLMFYWLSNAAGILLMYISGKALARKGESTGRVLFEIIITIAAYSLILIFLDKLGILKPVRF